MTFKSVALTVTLFMISGTVFAPVLLMGNGLAKFMGAMEFKSSGSF